EYLPAGVKLQPKTQVLVYGGSATAAWVVEKLLDDGCGVTWLARPGAGEKKGAEFRDANPAGRNQRVMDVTADLRIVGTIAPAGLRPIRTTTDGKQRLRVQWSEMYWEKHPEKKVKDFALLFDKLI